METPARPLSQEPTGDRPIPAGGANPSFAEEGESPSFDLRAKIGILVLVLVYVEALAIFGAFGHVFGVTKTVIVPVLLAIAAISRRFKLFLKDWSLFLCLTILFDCTRGVVFALVSLLELPVHMTGVINAEKLITRGIAPVALQGALFGGHTIGPFEKFQVAVHAAHFFTFLVFGMWVWLVRREHFHKFTVSMLALMYLGLVAFLVFPTVPPWMASLGYRAIPPLVKIRSVVYDSSLPVIQAGLDTNPIAAMPSLHAAFAMLCCLIGLHLFKKRAWPLVVYTGLVAFAIIYLGEHYLVDVLAGWVLSAIIYWIVFRRAERFTTRQSGNSGRITEVKFLVPACLIILIGTEALAHLRDRIRVPYLPTRSFIESELRGRSPLAGYYGGLRDFQDANYPAAERELSRSVNLVSDDPQMSALAYVAIGKSAFHNSDFDAALRAFKMAPRTYLDREAIEMLARSSGLNVRDAALGTDRSHSRKARLPGVHWLNWQ